MLMPQELKKHEFEHALRGYSTTEVDEYIEFICNKYEELYRQNSDLERKLVAALRLVDEVTRRHSAGQSPENDSSLRAGRILQEAERQKKRIVADAEEYADRIIADADAHVARQAQTLEEMKQAVLTFRDDLYARYSRQIDQIEELAASVQEKGIAVPAPIRETLSAMAAAEPSVDGEGIRAAAEMPLPEPELPQEAEPEEEESLLIFPLEAKEEVQEDGIDEDELAATDEALAFFEDFGETSETAPEDEAEPEEEEFFVYEDDDTDGGDTAENADDDAGEESDAEFAVLYEDAESEEAPAEDPEFDEFGDAVIPGGEPIGDDEDPLAGFDERIAALLGSAIPAADGADLSADGEFAEEIQPEPQQDEPEDFEIPEEQSDEELLEELRHAFDVQLEAFAREDAAERRKSKAEKEEDFSFLPENEEPEPAHPRFPGRLSGRSHNTKKKDK